MKLLKCKKNLRIYCIKLLIYVIMRVTGLLKRFLLFVLTFNFSLECIRKSSKTNEI